MPTNNINVKRELAKFSTSQLQLHSEINDSLLKVFVMMLFYFNNQIEINKVLHDREKNGMLIRRLCKKKEFKEK